jgi:hypothetical protein
LRDFFDTKPFGAACTGLAVLATSYVAGVTGWHLIILPALTMMAYDLSFSAQRPRRLRHFRPQ